MQRKRKKQEQARIVENLDQSDHISPSIQIKLTSYFSPSNSATSSNPSNPTDPAQQHQTHPSYTLLASCMHAGTRIVRLTSSEGGEWEFGVQAKFEEHKSMNYGSDVQPLIGGGGAGGVEGEGDQQQEKEERKRVIVSTSFYDRLMCVWRA
jgi:diphthamide biosynthesis protein 7